MCINVCYLGEVEYQEALFIQERIWALRVEKKIGDTLLLLEHPPVITIGRRGSKKNILVSDEFLKKMDVKVFEVSRGGDVTYHGPGQLVGYPIFDLALTDRDIKKFVYLLEEVFIRLLKDQFGKEAHRDENKYTGVWVGNDKIVAIGIAVKKWVTMHGFAFNVNTNLEHFSWIVPCGLKDRGVTSLERLIGSTIRFEDVVDKVQTYFGKVFGKSLNILGKEKLFDLLKI
ncbi:lipoyl(octanoyl) transferase [Caldicellulosiruptor bescii]|uniref:Octanoyltransferase n=2 Tax=Caldicellulosiruptor bescii TaxID=31899 RepID=LIPB_CALBD|nr:lipoyl(octanoyl) transferase LipB [Caldicellulosiruptor bescii]B9MQ23.1 RecName: Full=Octanoyltransferase; AltName: Full=Lipoate-protein ligase B; AltName: Full=Lipoyl/octanoyl transferase; AltName: Full=Octanoyl-[acyl-carrier-protein]-protein N-octanoyltransferase [Caldicellulosiruptor bescii DSM 6725]ACM59815.1 lipoate-protein ligase B [Caldicellulosiruptor bescii DSM 6725]PBC87225.1 lipoyl(octanoyl) transferase [Caldicellulosiruptor bescii]PBC90164.1 lipoyl(octanoyl) transferase [Caldicel